MRKLLLLLGLLFALSDGAWAQNTTCSNRPASDNSNACANTRFVQTAISSFPGANPGGTNGQVQYNNAGAFGGFTLGGDATLVASTGVMTLNSVNSNTGTWGGATFCAAFTVNAKGLITAAAQSACTPAIANVTGLGTGVATALGTAVSTAGGLPVIIAKGSALALGTSAISSGTCATAVTATATGVTTNDTLNVSFSADPTAVTGYTPSTNGMLTIIPYLSANNINVKVCNNTLNSITPGAIGLNWIVVR